MARRKKQPARRNNLVAIPKPPPEQAAPLMPVDERGIPLPPPIPANIAHGVLIQFHPSVRGTSFTFWGMPLEDALTNTLDAATRLHIIHMQVLGVGLPGMPMSLQELDEMYTAKVTAMQAHEAMMRGTEPSGPPTLTVVGGSGAMDTPPEGGGTNGAEGVAEATAEDVGKVADGGDHLYMQDSR